MSEQVTNTSSPSFRQPEKKNTSSWLKRKLKHDRLFLLFVVLPTIISLIYFGLIASNQYMSQSTFVVRSAKNQNSVDNGLGVLFQGLGVSRSQDDAYAVQSYIGSRSALNAISQSVPVRSYYEKHGDLWSRFNGFRLPFWNSEEAFYQYYSKQMDITLDPVSGISTLSVWSFKPEQSQQINQALLDKAEQLVNQINDRAKKDTIAYAMDNVRTAQDMVIDSSTKLKQYRVSNRVLDLKEQSGVQMSLLANLQSELISVQTQLDQVKALTPENPQISGLKTREKSLKREIARQMELMTGDDKSIAGQAAEYQQLILQNTLAEKQLAAAITALESAKAEAGRQQLYLEVLSTPHLSDYAQRPTRLYHILATFFIGFLIYGILKLMIASIREHRN